MSRTFKYGVEIGNSQKNAELNCCESIGDFFEDKFYKFKQSTTRQKIKYIIIMLTVFIWFLLPILNIIIGSIFANKTICQKTNNASILVNNTNVYVEKVGEISSTVNLSTWLIINGVFWLTLMILSGFYLNIEKIDKNKDTCFENTKNVYLVIFPIIVIIFIMFLFCWMIVGTVSFWRDCGDDIDSNVKGCMYFTLICELVYVTINVLWIINKSFWKFMEFCGY